MLGLVLDALMVGAFVGVALATMLPAFGVALVALGLAIALPVATLWFLWYSLAYFMTLLME